jgi:hypothetical protein
LNIAGSFVSAPRSKAYREAASCSAADATIDDGAAPTEPPACVASCARWCLTNSSAAARYGPKDDSATCFESPSESMSRTVRAFASPPRRPISLAVALSPILPSRRKTSAAAGDVIAGAMG